MYAAGENITNKNSQLNEAWGGSVVYRGGPLTAQGYWQTATQGAAVTSGTVEVDVDQYGLGAGWNFGMFRLAFNWGEAKLKGTGTAITEAKNTAYGLGGGVMLGGGELLVNFIDREITVAGSSAEKPSASTWGIAYTYPLSKRTNVYASYGQTNNNATGRFALNYSQSLLSANAVGEDIMGFVVGVRHQF